MPLRGGVGNGTAPVAINRKEIRPAWNKSSDCVHVAAARCEAKRTPAIDIFEINICPMVKELQDDPRVPIRGGH
jgi:2-phospho-L-lactate guanylyltransferase (CobY/MobA/RfbA family)